MNQIRQKTFLHDQKETFFTIIEPSRNQGAVSLTVTAKSSFERHQNFSDVWRQHHCHQLLSMTIFVIVICRHSHRHFFVIFSTILVHAKVENEEK